MLRRSSKTVMRSLIASLCCAILALSCAARDRDADGQSASKVSQNCLQGAYIQLLDRHARWNELEWRGLFDHLVQLQVGYVVVQWSAIDRRAFYRAAPNPPGPDLPLESIMRMADASGMLVLVGLSHDPAYWRRIQQADKRAYLAERLRVNRLVSAEVRGIVASHASFSGWYISEEIDDVNWTDPAERVWLFRYVEELSSHLRMLTPSAHVGLSGFANRHTAPQALRDFWIDLLARAPVIDQIYFQDGIGVDKLTLAELPQYYEAMRAATVAAGRELVPVVETFRQSAGPPVSAGEFKAEPTTLHRLFEQIAIANRYADRHVAFGVPEYLTPAGGAQASRLYQDYRDALRTREQPCQIAKPPIRVR